MPRDLEPDDHLAEDILRGCVSAVPGEYHSLAQVMASIRSTPDAAAPEPSAALRQVFTEGIRREEQTETALLAAPVARPRRWRRWVPRAAGLGLATKIGLAGAAAAAMAAGAGATGSLPGQDGPPSFLPWQIDAPAEEPDPGRDLADEADDGPGVDGPTVVERTGDPLRGDGGVQPPGDAAEADRGADERAPRGEDADDVADDARELREEAGEPGPRESPADPPAPEVDRPDGPPTSDDDPPDGPPTSDDDRPDGPAASGADASSSPAEEPSGGAATGDEGPTPEPSADDDGAARPDEARR